MNFYPDHFTSATPPDIVHETENGTYLGWFDRHAADNNTNIEEQPIWCIRFMESKNDSGTGIFTRTLYPNGTEQYNNRWTEHIALTYSYKR